MGHQALCPSFAGIGSWARDAPWQATAMAWPAAVGAQRGARVATRRTQTAGLLSPDHQCVAFRIPLTAARELVLPALYPHAARGLPVLADKGYTGAGIGVHVPIKHQPDGPLHTDNRCYNRLITALRAPAERGNARLGRWRALDRVTVSPHRISAIVAAALVLTSLDRGSR
jgi:hypothetical protein